LEISSAQSTGTSQPSTTEPPILKAAQELLIAEAVSKQQNINLNRLMKARSHTPGLYEAVAVIMEAKWKSRCSDWERTGVKHGGDSV
jgi:hypothetical protein